MPVLKIRQIPDLIPYALRIAYHEDVFDESHSFFGFFVDEGRRDLIASSLMGVPSVGTAIFAYWSQEKGSQIHDSDCG